MSGKSSQQRFTLLTTEAAHPSGVGDADLVHGSTGFHLADPWKRFEDRQDLGLANQFIGLTLLQDLGERDRPELETLLELGACFAGSTGLFEGCCSLFR